MDNEPMRERLPVCAITEISINPMECGRRACKVLCMVVPGKGASSFWRYLWKGIRIS